MGQGDRMVLLLCGYPGILTQAVTGPEGCSLGGRSSVRTSFILSFMSHKPGSQVQPRKGLPRERTDGSQDLPLHLQKIRPLVPIPIVPAFAPRACEWSAGDKRNPAF